MWSGIHLYKVSKTARWFKTSGSPAMPTSLRRCFGQYSFSKRKVRKPLLDCSATSHLSRFERCLPRRWKPLIVELDEIQLGNHRSLCRFWPKRNSSLVTQWPHWPGVMLTACNSFIPQGCCCRHGLLSSVVLRNGGPLAASAYSYPACQQGVCHPSSTPDRHPALGARTKWIQRSVLNSLQSCFDPPTFRALHFKKYVHFPSPFGDSIRGIAHCVCSLPLMLCIHVFIVNPLCIHIASHQIHSLLRFRQPISAVGRFCC